MCIAGKKPHCEKLFVIGGASGRLIQVYVCIIYENKKQLFYLVKLFKTSSV